MDLKIWVNCEIRNICNFLKNKSCLYQFSIHCDTESEEKGANILKSGEPTDIVAMGG